MDKKQFVHNSIGEPTMLVAYDSLLSKFGETMNMIVTGQSGGNVVARIKFWKPVALKSYTLLGTFTSVSSINPTTMT
jgi:hypothetical protein